MRIKSNKKNTILYEDAKASLEILLNGDFSSFSFDERFFRESFFNYESMEEFQKTLSRIHETSTNQKKDGVFYTPSDLCDYIVANSVLSIFDSEKNDYVSTEHAITLLLKSGNANSFVFEKKVLDPTSGTGEFLVSVLKLKLYLLNKIKADYNIDDVLLILSTINGNDIDSEANCISKIRLFLLASHFLNSADSRLALALKNNFTTFDFLTVGLDSLEKYDLIVGNPPYVEKTRISKYGNIYADILENASYFIKTNGVLGFVIPLSYVSTPRMSGIRTFIESKFKKQLITNYADRPASLFARVHQKLTIVLLTNNSSNDGIYVSDYKYFYKDCRKQLLSGSKLVKIDKTYGFYPKLGNKLELNILSKIYTKEGNNLVDLADKTGSSVFLNMRAYFWNKAFTFMPKSSEYKEFRYKPEIKNYILCILNSSLFWYFWVITSDCWHITNKELKSFKVIANKKVNFELFDQLAKKLEEKLESTKEYIGTVQADFAYKHKYCKDIIDEIDDALAPIYGLTKLEIELVKNYGLQYRVGRDDE